MSGVPNGKPETRDPNRILIHAAYPLWRKHMLVAVARAKELQDEGKDVALTYCVASRGTCAINYLSNPVTCRVCRSRVKSMASEAGLPIIPLDPALHSPRASDAISDAERASLSEGVQSGITSTFRTLPKDSDSAGFIQRVKSRYQRTAEGLLAAMTQIVGQRRPDLIEVFSGRHACSRFALLAAQQARIPFNTLEITATKRPIVFRGHTPHDRKQIQQRMLGHPADMELAGDFYRRRRQPRDNKHARRHAKDFTPPSSDGFAKKVTVFLSSQDEFEALGKEWKSPFDDYASIVAALCAAHPSYLFCVRFHPNQSDISSDIISPFDKIAACHNARVYYPKDSINTYGLIDWSDTVITFGSTVTVEACWMGKPVILLGPSFFDELQVSYTPRSLDEAKELLRQELAPRDRTNAARFARYFLTDGDSMKYVQEGKPFAAKDFRLAHPILGWMARISDNVLCNVIKMCINAPSDQASSRKAA